MQRQDAFLQPFFYFKINRETMDLVVELKIENPNDWATIERLLKRLKVNFVRKSVELPIVSKEQSAIEELYALLDAGVDVSNYGDPIEFQREAREDVVLPFRD
jgi:hypothetical protein